VEHLAEDYVIEELSRLFTDARLVSLQIDYQPTQAALTMQGYVGIGRHNRGQWPAQIDDLLNMVGPTDGLASALGTNGTGFANLDEVEVASSYVASATRPATGTLFGTDALSRSYRSTAGLLLETSPSFPAIVDTSVVGSDLTQFFETHFVNIDGIDEDGIYFIPGQLSYVEITTDEIGTPFVPTNRPTLTQVMAMPWLSFFARGLATSTGYGRLTVTANWEGIPRAAYAAIRSPLTSPSDPVALAHAMDIATVLPAAFDPSMPDSSNTKIFQAAADCSLGKQPVQKKEKSGVLGALGDVADLAAKFAPLALTLLA
jgi:hypothetical protein